MKFDQLRSIAHNIADSLASGVGLPIGVYLTNIFDEATVTPEGFITIDFLTGSTSGGRPSPSLDGAIVLYRDALVDLCREHGTAPSAFRQLNARYSVDEQGGARFAVTIEDCRGRHITDEYEGLGGRRVRVLDQLGRIRPKPGVT